MEYFHPDMHTWSEEEIVLARRLDARCWEPLVGLYHGEKVAMGWRRQHSLEQARKAIDSRKPLSVLDKVLGMKSDHNPEERKPMSHKTTNHSLAVFLINRDVRGIMCSYEPNSHDTKTGKPPFYLFKTLDQSIKVGDLVIIPTDTRWGYTVVRVEEVDVEPDFDSQITYKWLVGAVDKGAYDHILAQENEAIARIKTAEKRAARDELKEKLFKSHEEDLKSLPLYKNGGTAPALETPKTPKTEPAALHPDKE